MGIVVGSSDGRFVAEKRAVGCVVGVVVGSSVALLVGEKVVKLGIGEVMLVYYSPNDVMDTVLGC